MAAKKTSASKTSSKAASKKRKAISKKAAPQKSAIKKILVKKAAVKKALAKKAGIKKAPVKKASVKKPSVKRTAAKKPVAKPVVKKVIAEKAGIKKIATKKIAAKKILARKPAVKKTIASRPAPKAAAPARVSQAAPRKVTPSKGANGSVKKRVRQSLLIFNSQPVTPPRRAASVMPTTKTDKEPLGKVAGSVRIPVRTAATVRRAARSAARGMAPGAVQTSAPLDQKPRRVHKSKSVIDGPLSEQKLREAIRTAVFYLEAWLKSSGADLPPAIAERSAPAEAARAQIWRWLDREAHFGDGRVLTAALLEDALNQEMVLLRKDIGDEAVDAGLFVTAAELFLDLALATNFEDFPGAASKLLD